LAMFDRMIFKGHLSALYKQDGARCFLWTQGVALKDFTGYAKATTERIANHARKLATDAGRPVISFDHIKTRNRTQHKDELAKSIAEADGITEGIICLISAGRVVLKLPGPPPSQQRSPGAVPPGAEVSAPLPVCDRPGVRVHARADRTAATPMRSSPSPSRW